MTGWLSTSKQPDRARRLAGWAVLAGGLVGLLLSLAVGEWGRRTLFDTWQRAAPRTVSEDRVAVVLIDSRSLETVGPWPWPRYYMARLTEAVAAQQPKAIGFDIVFAEPDALSPASFAALYPELDETAAARIARLPTMDATFARVIGSAPVMLSRLGVERDGADPSGLMNNSAVVGRPPAGSLAFREVLASIPELDDVALAHAMLNGPPDEDGTVRRVPLSVVASGTVMPGMAVELARLASDVEQLTWQGDRLLLGSISLPADGAGRLPIRLGHFPKRAAFAADEVIAGKVPTNAFAGKVVLIGLGAEGTADIVATPLQTEVYGVLVQAQAVDAILGGGWLARPGWVVWGEWAVALMLVISILFAGGTRRYWLLGVAGLLGLVLWPGSFVAFDRANLLFDPLRPTMIGLSAAVAMWVTLYVLARAERARLAAALVDQRVAAAAQEGELNAARRIQQGMVPGAERLASLDPRAEIGAVLRPAKSVGGDFYDALMLDAHRLLFVIGDVTGKGVPAALYMALSKALAKSILARSGDDLGAAVAALNRDLMNEADDEMGVTLLAGVLNCRDGSLIMVNAGHENPLAVRGGGEVATLPLRGGPPLCVVDFPYPQETAQLAAGETLVLITDGATEAQDAASEMLGLEGVVAALRGEGDMPAPERAIDLADRVRAFEGDTEPSDDLTIVALRWRGA